MIRVVYVAGVLLRMYLVHSADMHEVSSDRVSDVAIENAYAVSAIPNHQMEDLQSCGVVSLCSGKIHKSLKELHETFMHTPTGQVKVYLQKNKDRIAGALGINIIGAEMAALVDKHIEYTVNNKPYLNTPKIRRYVSEEDAVAAKCGPDLDSRELRFRLLYMHEK